MRGGLSILVLARFHHEIFLEALRETPADDLTEVATAASEFFLEVLATFDMTQRSLFDGRTPMEETTDPRPGSGDRASRPRAVRVAGARPSSA